MTKKDDTAFEKTQVFFKECGLLEIDQSMTKGEFFAAMAMQGLLTRIHKRHNDETDLGVIESKRIAEESVTMADELIKALNKKK